VFLIVGGEENLDEQVKEKAWKESSQGPDDDGPAQEAREGTTLFMLDVTRRCFL
jgi:hypothetical protein